VMNEGTSDGSSVGKVAFLKELGRAAYINPLNSELLRSDREGLIKRSAAQAKAQSSKVGKCPVCGHETLAVEEDFDEESDSNFTEAVSCTLCTFHLTKEVKANLKDFKIEAEDFWT
jgi:DNA-directed RNA polymerase subunit M/transcription elongation factor TFIIS